MSMTWSKGTTPAPAPPKTAAAWARVTLRAIALIVVVFGGLLILLSMRLFERPLHGINRPWTPTLTKVVCRTALRILGLELRVTGTPMQGQGAVVANHSSWLDIFVLNASKRIYFVSKSEVARWPGIGWLARATGTVFLVRDRRQAAAQTKLFQARLLAGHKLLFFPEGTSTDGQQVLPFKTTLFQSFFAPELKETLSLQPASVTYHAPAGHDPRFYGWWGSMTFGAHLLSTLAPAKQGYVDVIYHPPLAVRDYGDRKTLAKAAEDAVRAGLNA